MYRDMDCIVNKTYCYTPNGYLFNDHWDISLNTTNANLNMTLVETSQDKQSQ